MRKIIILILLFVTRAPLGAQTVTWSQDVACIIFSHCTRCHNNTESLAAIPLTNYHEAWSQRNAILYYVDNKLMPPYQPTLTGRKYIHEKRLTQEEIDIIVKWVEQGAQEGDSSMAPKAPIINDLSPQIKLPDFSRRITPYKVPDTVSFKYRCFVLPGIFNQTKNITELEILPTDLSAVYSAWVYSDTSEIPIKLDALDPDNGYNNYAGIGSPTAKLLYGWVNGNHVYKPPPGMSLTLDSGSHLILRILFAEDAMNKVDSTQVNIKFDSSGQLRPIQTAALLHHNKNLLNPPLLIPADSIKTYVEKYTVPSNISIIGISHWGQKICSKMECLAVLPTLDTLHLLEIEDHEDLWSQGIYHFANPVKLPAGTLLYGVAEFNNTYWNSNNPFDPPHTIYQGDSDTSEQMIFSFAYTPYQTKDENIVADSIIHQTHYLDCAPRKLKTQWISAREEKILIYPNPVNSELIISSDYSTAFVIEIYNSIGRIVLREVYLNSRVLDLTGISPGVYTVHIKSAEINITKKIIKQ